MTTNALMVKPPPAAAPRAGVPVTDLQAARLHLRALNPGAGLTEIRWWRRGDKPIQQWFADPDEAAAYAYARRDEGDVYFGVVPRARRAGGSDALIHTARVLWVECDEPMATTRALALQPHIVVQSSLPGKTHVYWLVREQLDMVQLKRALRRLAFHLGGDMKATDPARILRVPGCTHRKGDPLPVMLLDWSGAPNVSAADLVKHLPDPAPPRVRTAPMPAKLRNTETEYLSVVPASVYVPRLTGRELGRDGMICCPFHKGGAERSPSFSTGGPQDTLWFCFGCDEGGDIFRLAARLEGLNERTQFPHIINEVKRRLG